MNGSGCIVRNRYTKTPGQIGFYQLIADFCVIQRDIPSQCVRATASTNLEGGCALGIKNAIWRKKGDRAGRLKAAAQVCIPLGIGCVAPDQTAFRAEGPVPGKRLTVGKKAAGQWRYRIVGDRKSVV